MRCKNCPAYWESRDYWYGVEDWGCHCDPDNKYNQYEYANGDLGCHRKKEYIKKIMAEVHYDEALRNVCRLDLYSVKSTDCCENYESCIEEKDNDWEIIKRVTTIVLILIGINSLFADFILQKEIAKYTDNFWIMCIVGFIFLCPIFNLIFIAIKDINKVIK